jgi:hypothetical protein
VARIENVREAAVEPGGPEIRARFRLKGARLSAAGSRVAHAALEDVANAEFASDLPYIDRLALLATSVKTKV